MCMKTCKYFMNPSALLSYIISKYNILSLYKYNKCRLLYARYEYKYLNNDKYELTETQKRKEQK